MKKIIAAIILSVTVHAGFAQVKFKEVKTAKDVIDNNITATGGAEKINGIKSETLNGDLIIGEMKIGFFVFRNDTVSLKKAEGEAHGQNMILLKSLTTKSYAWEYQMNGIREFAGEELLSRQSDLITGNINFVLNYKNKGYTAELNGTDTVNGKLCYKVVFSKDGEMIRTDFYDSETFYLAEILKPKDTKLYFSDYREVSGIYRPFKIDQYAQTDLTILFKEYIFNKTIDPELLEKPTDK